MKPFKPTSSPKQQQTQMTSQGRTLETEACIQLNNDMPLKADRENTLHNLKDKSARQKRHTIQNKGKVSDNEFRPHVGENIKSNKSNPFPNKLSMINNLRHSKTRSREKSVDKHRESNLDVTLHPMNKHRGRILKSGNKAYTGASAEYLEKLKCLKEENEALVNLLSENKKSTKTAIDDLRTYIQELEKQNIDTTPLTSVINTLSNLKFSHDEQNN